MGNIDLSYVIGLPPKKAVEYFDQKGYRFSWDWQDTWQEAHAKAFTAAKVMRMDILQDLRDGCRQVLAEGTPYKDVMEALVPKLQAKGWWGKKWVADETGGKLVQLGSPQRLKLILEQNTRTAYNVARWQGFEENKGERPYIMWVGIEDTKTCPICAPLIGSVHRIDDPLFDYFFPGNCHFRDRCRARALGDRDIERKGLTVQSSEGRLSHREIADPDGTVRSQAVYHDGLTGQDISPAPGFSYNPARAAWQPDLDKYDNDIAKQYVEGAVTGPDFTRFFEGKAGGDFPVAVLDPEFMKTIGSKSQAVYLSGETMAKNLENHPDLTLKEYQSLPDIISQDAEVVLQQGDRRLIFVKKKGRFYNAVLKTANDGNELFLLSFRRVHYIRRDVERLMRQDDVKVIKNEL